MARAKKEDTTEYEVEAVCKARVNYKKGTHIRWQYLVKWKGYGDKDNTWEPEECFEESPGLLRAFWRLADIGERKKGEERKHTRASDFKVHEEISPRDGPVSSSAVTDADEEVIEKPRVGRKKGVSNSVRRKRSLSENDETAAKRRRGRSAKNAQTITDGSAEADANGDSASQVDDEPNVPDQTPQQVPENLYSNEKRVLPTKKQDAGPSPRRPHASEPRKKSQPSEMRELQSKNTATRIRKRRFIESDEDEDAQGESDRESQAGSLFSEAEHNPEDKKETNINSVSPGEKQPIDGKKLQEKRHKITVYDESRLEMMRLKLLTKKREQKPRVSVIHDPEVERAINERVNRFLKTPTDKKAQTDTAEKEGNTPIAPKELDPKPVNDSLLLTTSTNSLVTKESGTSSTFPDGTDSIAHVVSGSGTTGSKPTMEHNISLPPIVEPSISHATPAQLVDVNKDLADLEDFEDPNDVIGTTEKPSDHDALGCTSNAETNVSTSVEVVEETRAWTLSTIFAPAAPPPGSELPPESVVATKPGRNLIQLRLSPDVSIPIRFKDVLPASWDVNETLTTLLPGEHDGLPGKLYPQDVLNHLALGGSTARLATDETATRGQSELFQSLTSQLEENGHIVILALNCLTFLILPSQNRSLASRIGIPESLIGLGNSLLIQNVKISNDTDFLNFALDAKDIVLTNPSSS